MIGLSILSGSHRELIPSVLEALREAGVGDVPVVVGGIIPEADAAALREAGVAAVYTPKDWDLNRMMRDIVALVGERHGVRFAPPSLEPDAGRRELGGAPARGRPERRAGRAEPGREPHPARPRAQTAALLAAVSPAALGGEAPAHVVGITGPPGVGKSSLLSRLVARWRGAGRSVAVLAVDPTSRRSGGALLGDRARIEVDPADRGVFIRSTAAGDRLGGLAPATRAAASALAAAFDVVVIETVGVGQSETEVADVADTVAVVVQPGSGDVLQFLKSGIMEVPDVLVVTKSDLGPDRRPDASPTCWRRCGRSAPPSVEVVAVSSVAPSRDRRARARRSIATAPALDLRGAAVRGRAGCTRWRTSPTEYGERGPARRSAAAARPSGGCADQEPGLDVARVWSGCSAVGRGRSGIIGA